MQSRFWFVSNDFQEKHMCGIAGILKFDGRPANAGLLEPMIATLGHRGPDGSGVFAQNEVGLAHARLSIIDLAGGHQPMSIDNGNLWITFNGEIFNYVELREELIQKGHKFSTRSDTEVILHLYQEEGKNCVRRLNGQWAFAIWDVKKKSLFVSRDRIGIRPLHYTRTRDSFVFASEAKALFAHPDVERALDLQALDEIFTFWVTLPPRTAFRNVSQLPPGHSLIVESGEVRIEQYWKLEYAPQEDCSTEAEKRYAEELLALLLDATRIRLRSDVPVGAYLSGGLDSTFISALTKSLVGDRLRTFSVGFEDAEFDESAYQREASQYLSTQHSEVRCSYEDIGCIFPDVIRHTEQPVLRTAPAPLYLLSKLVRDSGFKVVLTGEGADEMLGGYDIFKEAKIRRFWGRNPNSRMRPMLLKRLYPYMENIQRQPAAYLKKFFHVDAADMASPFFSHTPRWELTGKLKAFFSDAVLAETCSYDALPELERMLPDGYRSWDPSNQAEYLEAQYLLPGYILSSQGDRMAMANSVEGRYPFLDYRVIEFAAKLPPSMKMKVLNQKHLLKMAAKNRIPESITKRPKQPYRAPDGASFIGTKNSYAEEMLSAEQVRRHGIFNPKAVDALVAKFKSGRPCSTKDNMALVGVLSTQLVMEQFIAKSDYSQQQVPRQNISTAELEVRA